MSEQVTSVTPEQPATPAYEAVAEQPKKSGGLAKKIIGFVVVAGIVVAVKFGLGAGLGELWANITGDVTTASVGDCVNAWDKADDAKVVDCGDSAAKYTVVGIVEDKYTQAAFNALGAFGNPCSDFPTAESAIWVGGRSTGDVWCLAAK